MKRKTIERMCREALEGWIASLPDALQKTAMDNAFIAGGAIVSLLQGEKVNDWDIYLRTTDAAKAIAEHYVEQMKDKIRLTGKMHRIAVTVQGDRVKVVVQSAGIVGAQSDTDDYAYFEEVTDTEPERIDNYVQIATGAFDVVREELYDDYEPVFLSSNAITLGHATRGKPDVQIILRFTGEPATIVKGFDWQHTTNYFSLREGLVLNRDAVTCVALKELRYQRTQYPLAALLRSYKFIERGWQRPHAGDILVLVQQLVKLDWSDPKTWEDQLTGVDVAYLFEVIGRINVLLKEGKGMDEIISTYLVQIVEETL